MRQIILSCFAIAFIVAEPVAAEQPRINQISPVIQGNQNIYLHPAHGFPGRALGSTTVQTINKINPMAANASIQSRANPTRPALQILPVMAGESGSDQDRS